MAITSSGFFMVLKFYAIHICSICICSICICQIAIFIFLHCNIYISSLQYLSLFPLRFLFVFYCTIDPGLQLTPVVIMKYLAVRHGNKNTFRKFRA